MHNSVPMNGLRDASAVFHVLCILAVNVEYGNDDVSSNTVLGQVNFQESNVTIVWLCLL